MMNKTELVNLAKKVRKHVLKMTLYSKSSHIGAALSMVEILIALYFLVLNVDPKNPNVKDRDKFILSKAHGSVALYAVLAEKGFFPISILEKTLGVLEPHISVYG